MIYVLHFARPLRHARHYVGFTADLDVERRVAEHLEQRGRRPSRQQLRSHRPDIALEIVDLGSAIAHLAVTIAATQGSR